MQLSKPFFHACHTILFFSSFALIGREIQLQDKLSHVPLGTVRSIEIGRHSFIPIEKFAELLAIPVEQNVHLKTISLNYKQNRIGFTAFTPYVKFNNFEYQMSTEVRFPNREFYVPLADLIKGLNASGINTVEYDEAGQIIRVMTRPANIVRLSTLSKNDTTKLVLHTTSPFKKSDISTHAEKDWLYININGGVIDIKDDMHFDIPQVFEFLPLQANRDQARLSLHLAPNVSLSHIDCQESAREIVITLTAAATPSAALTDLEREREKWKIDTIIIDPGHGGRDPGCVGPGNIFEKNITLAIAVATKQEIERRMDVKVILTRDRDAFAALQNRTKKANEAGGKLFISIHVDANRVKSLRGHTVYFLGPAKTNDAREVAQFENSVIQFEDSQNEYANLSDAAFILAANAQNSYNKESQDFASMVDQEIKTQCGSRSHGVRQAGFYVLYGASMPNILVETGFMTNSYDRTNLNNPSYQRSLAKAITNGVIKFKDRYESTTF
ncbi:N-acetylmuramoyl-L-alanine amidase [candidate division KSB1 bacterium]|nr:N-acetylmuramoyl-L-alanine amidase [candidate division KSB1 bacterium]